MDQKKIVDGLLKALNQGSGGLDDLDELLKRAQQDVEKAKEEEKARVEEDERKHGIEIAELANRLLEGKLTDADVSVVLNAWCRQNGYEPLFKDDSIRQIFDNVPTKSELSAELESAAQGLVDAIGELADLFAGKKSEVKVEKPAAKPKKEKDTDDVINDFLKSFGIR